MLRLFAIIIVSLSWISPLSFAATLNAVEYSAPESGKTVITNRFDDTVKADIFTIPGQVTRIVADVQMDKLGLESGVFADGQTHFGGQGHVEALRVARQKKGVYRLVYDLNPGAQLVSHDIKDTVLTFEIKGEAEQTSSKPQNSTSTVKYERKAYTGGPRYFSGVPYPRVKPLNNYTPPRKYVVVIDPGHGGRDPGAIGGEGTYEKKITFKAAKELKTLLSASGRYDVILTRDDDSYVDHEERIRIARAKNADLFISIHADSAGTKSVRGASVYTLADRALKRSKNIVNSQNWIMDVDLSEHTDPVGDILVDLAQRKTRSQSDVFAKRLIKEVSGATTLVNNSHRRAGYFVLLAPDVPAVLLELGFLSNATDEKLLKSPTHRQKVLKKVKTAIDGYFTYQNP